MYGGVRGRKTKVGEKLHRFPPTRLSVLEYYSPLHRPLYTSVEGYKNMPIYIGKHCKS